jgi:hypothetical protein
MSMVTRGVGHAGDLGTVDTILMVLYRRNSHTSAMYISKMQSWCFFDAILHIQKAYMLEWKP